MKRSPLWVRLVCQGLSFCMVLINVPLAFGAEEPLPDSGESIPADIPQADLPHSVLTLGALTTEDYFEAIGDVVIPFYFNGTDLLYINPRASFTDRDTEEYNLGLGYRRLIRNNRAIIGANAFFDHRETQLGASFDQIGFGVEYLSHFFDARANVYVPLEDKELVNTFDASESSTVRSVTSSTGEVWTDPYAQGNTVLQDLETINTTRIRTTTYTTTRTFREYEIAMEGWDAEAGVRLPIALIEDFARAKLFGGYYFYNGTHGLDDVDGFRGRLEVQFKPSIFLDAVYYSDDDLTGGNFSLGLYFSAPFDLANIAAGKNPFAGAADHWEEGREPTSVSHRLGDMVKRDPQVRTLLAAPETVANSERSSVETQTSTKKKTLASTTEEVATDITFVDGDAGNDANPGTFEAPKLTVQGGVDEPRTMVFVHEMEGTYEENVVLTDNVVLRGAGQPITAFGGKVFGTGVHPTLDGMSQGPTIRMANNTSVTGFRIQNTEAGGPAMMEAMQPASVGSVDVRRVGILANGVNELTIAHNIIEGNSMGALIGRQGDLDVTLLQNRVQNNSGDGVSIYGAGNSGTFTVGAIGNFFGGNQVGLDIDAENYDEMAVLLSGNTAVNNVEEGVDLTLAAEDLIALSVSGHTSTNNGADGIYGELIVTNGVALVSVGDSTLSDNGDDGLYLDLYASSAIAALGGLNAHNNANDGLEVNLYADAALMIAGLHPELAESMLDLFGLVGMGPLPVDPEFFPNSSGPIVANSNGDDGLDFYVEGTDLAVGLLFDLSANWNDDHGADIAIDSEYGFALGIASDTGMLLDVLDTGLDIVELVLGPSGIPPLPTVPAQYMVFDHNDDDGFNMRVEGDALALSLALGIQANGNDEDGVDLRTYSDSVAVALAGRILASHNDESGVDTDTQADGLALSLILDTEANDNGEFGIDQYTAADTAIALIASTDPLRSLVDVVNDEMELDPPIMLAGTPFGPVRANGNGTDGVYSALEADSLTLGLYLDIQANENAEHGIHLDLDSYNGSALALVGSTDLLFELVPGLLSMGPIDYTPMGPVEVIENGGIGLFVEMDAADDVALVGGLINAFDTTADTDAGHGIAIDQYSEFGSTMALLANIDASDNEGNGIHYSADASEDAYFNLIIGDLWENNGSGLDLDMYVENGEVSVLLASVYANENGAHGATLNIDAEDYFGLAVTGSQMNDNGEDGLQITAAVEGDIDLFIGAQAAYDLTDGFTGSFLGVLPAELLEELIPHGGNEFNENDGSGVNLNLTASDDATVVLADSEANENGGHGIAVLAASADGLSLLATNLVAGGNAGNGLLLDLDAGNVLSAYGSGNRIIGNTGIGFDLDAQAPTLDLNFGTGATYGLNAFTGNGTYDVRNTGAGTLFVENNWWGLNTDPVANGQTDGTVDAAPWLAADPNP